jgi:DeoR/GlpR family transcriptional regulator of sugar metabolism
VFAEDRRKLLLDRIKSTGTLSNADIADEFKVSMLTIRRDLEVLERDGLIRRVYGGAQHVSVPMIGNGKSVEFGQRSERNQDAKERIAKKAAQFIQDGETIYIDAGTTAHALSRALIAKPVRNLRIVTHAVNIANEFASHPGFKVFIIGGEIFEETRASTGQFTLDSIRRFSYDRFFLGCMGFDVHNGMTNARMPEVEIKNAAIERANWVCLIADSSKWAVNTFASIAPIERCNCIVSDSALPKFAQHEIKRLGIALSLA